MFRLDGEHRGVGAIGQLVVGDLIHNGHQVVACLRSPDKTPSGWAGQPVSVIVGQMNDPAAIASTVSGRRQCVARFALTLARPLHFARVNHDR